jgi:hypothetical protein
MERAVTNNSAWNEIHVAEIGNWGARSSRGIRNDVA